MVAPALRERMPILQASAADPDFLPWMARRSLVRFTRRMFGPGYVPARHHALICDRLEAVSRGDLRFLIITMPPGHAKSTHASIHFPPWHLGNHPDDQIIAVSHGAALASDFSRKARAIVAHERWPFPDVRPDATIAQVSQWGIADHAGMYYASSIGGSVTGRRADVLLIDDPVKSQEEANSETYRERAWEWFTSDAFSRLKPRGRVVIIGTRFHEDDLIGRALNMNLPWDYLWLPAQAEPTEDQPDALGRTEGEYLWPEQFSDEDYEDKRRASERNWLTLYQGKPFADAGSTFKREWFDSRYTPAELPRLSDVCISIDAAFKTGAANDYSVFATWGTDGKGRYYLVDVWREKVEFPELSEAGYRVWRKARERFVDVYLLPEDAASAQSAIQVWKRDERRPDGTTRPRLPVVPVKLAAGESKIARAEGVTYLFEAGQVFLPATAPWLDAWIEEHVRFPFGTHDDQVDTTSMALARLSRPRPAGIVTM